MSNKYGLKPINAAYRGLALEQPTPAGTPLFKNRPAANPWPQTGGGPSCVVAEMVLLTGRVTSWPLTDHIEFPNLAAVMGENFVNNPFNVANPLYQHVTNRGGTNGALVFTGTTGGEGLRAADTGALYNPATSWTLGFWFRADSYDNNASLVTYTNDPGATVKYRLRITNSRWVFEMVGASGTGTITSSLPLPGLGRWSWIEMSYNATTAAIGLRIAQDRSVYRTPLGGSFQTTTVPGGTLAAAGALNLGYYGSGTNFGPDGAFTEINFWSRLLTDCERGLINRPTDSVLFS